MYVGAEDGLSLRFRYEDACKHYSFNGNLYSKFASTNQMNVYTTLEKYTFKL